MGRKPRYDPEGGWHHVMNRGIARQPVFHAAQDGRAFLSLLSDGHAEFGVEVHAFCLMTNHFHLLLHCPDGDLSSYMQRLGSIYTRYMNRRLGRDGAIFRGRFRSLLIDSDEYLHCAGRYIHRNPLDIRPRVALDQYRWSSFRHYCGSAEAPPWLHLSMLAPLQGGRDAYRRFVEAEDVPGAGSPLGWAIATAINEDDEIPVANRAWTSRNVALVMLQLADESLANRLEALLAFPTKDARQTAIRRARRRMNEHESLLRLANRALELAA